MKTLVLYDSQFGNTERVARAIGEALAAAGPTQVHALADAPELPPHLDLLVIGGPTQGHGMSRRQQDYLDALPLDRLPRLPFVAFDTRVHWPVALSGSAARSIAKYMSRKGAWQMLEPESFFVTGKEGPLAEGELQRAAAWTHRLMDDLAALDCPPQVAAGAS